MSSERKGELQIDARFSVKMVPLFFLSWHPSNAHLLCTSYEWHIFSHLKSIVRLWDVVFFAFAWLAIVQYCITKEKQVWDNEQIYFLGNLQFFWTKYSWSSRFLLPLAYIIGWAGIDCCFSSFSASSNIFSTIWIICNITRLANNPLFISS